jgi:hypothetical protein
MTDTTLVARTDHSPVERAPAGPPLLAKVFDYNNAIIQKNSIDCRLWIKNMKLSQTKDTLFASGSALR